MSWAAVAAATAVGVALFLPGATSFVSTGAVAPLSVPHSALIAGHALRSACCHRRSLVARFGSDPKYKKGKGRVVEDVDPEDDSIYEAQEDYLDEDTWQSRIDGSVLSRPVIQWYPGHIAR